MEIREPPPVKVCNHGDKLLLENLLDMEIREPPPVKVFNHGDKLFLEN